MALGEAFIYYVVRLILFAVVAGIGISAGIRLRKRKDAKTTNKE